MGQKRKSKHIILTSYWHASLILTSKSPENLKCAEKTVSFLSSIGQTNICLHCTYMVLLLSRIVVAKVADSHN